MHILLQSSFIISAIFRWRGRSHDRSQGFTREFDEQIWSLFHVDVCLSRQHVTERFRSRKSWFQWFLAQKNFRGISGRKICILDQCQLFDFRGKVQGTAEFCVATEFVWGNVPNDDRRAFEDSEIQIEKLRWEFSGVWSCWLAHLSTKG